MNYLKIVDLPAAAASRQRQAERVAKDQKRREKIASAKLRNLSLKPRVRAPRDERVEVTSFYDSREWLQLRYRVLRHFGARCQCCGAGRADGVIIQVDHIKPRSKFPELQLEFTNLQVLCKPCNQGKSNKDSTDWR